MQGPACKREVSVNVGVRTQLQLRFCKVGVWRGEPPRSGLNMKGHHHWRPLAIRKTKKEKKETEKYTQTQSQGALRRPARKSCAGGGSGWALW